MVTPPDIPDNKNSEERGLYWSLGVHVALLGFAIFGLPSFFKKEIEPVNMVTVELVPISSITNVPKAEEPVKAKEEPKKEEPKFEKKAPPPPPPPVEETKPEPVPEKKPEPEKAEPHPDIEKKKPPEKPKVKEETKPKPPIEKPKKKTDALDFDSVLKTVEKIEKKQAAEEKKEAKADESQKAKAKTSTLFDPSQSLSISERDAIIQQISQCWSIPAGAKDAQNLSVILHLSLEKDGTVRDVKIVDTSRYGSGDTFYRAAVDSAVRAVLKCSPLKNLPQDKYDSWNEIEMNFDPKEMLY